MIEPSIRKRRWRDYGGHETDTVHGLFEITDLPTLQEVLRRAHAERQPVRLRANGHSMNGLANPRAGEWLLNMTPCRSYELGRAGTVTVGAGAAIWDVHRELARHGSGLKVFNDGGAAASSVGGYLSAGGFGAPSQVHGGFWESVRRVRLVDGTGTLHDIGRDHPDFPWLFGAMGQLGVACELELATLGTGRPAGRDGLAGEITPSAQHWEPVLWFTLFVPVADGRQAQRALIEIGSTHRRAWRGRWPYAYLIRFHRFTPPLVSPHAGDLAAVGIWGDCLDRGEWKGGFDWDAVAGIRSAIHELLRQNPTWRRYVQTEHTPPGFDFSTCFDPATFGRFRERKRRYDPAGILSPGVFDPSLFAAGATDE